MNKDQRGFATVTTMLLLGIMLSFSVVLLDYILASRRAGRTLEGAFNATQVAEAGIQKALYCFKATSGVNCGGLYGNDYVGEANVNIGAGTFTTLVTGTGTNKTISSTGTAQNGRRSTIVVDVTTRPPEDNELSFAYALQSGEGGAHLENNASVQGTLYASGDIDCQTTAAGVTGDMFVSAAGGTIDGCYVQFDAHADNILDSEVDGDAYYWSEPAGIAGTTVAGTKYPGSAAPEPQQLPVFNTQFWRDSAEYGGTIYGDYRPADGSSLGPKKIDGDLIFDNNVDLTVTGPIWVKGDIITGNNSTFTLPSSWGAYSTVVMADDPDDQANKGRIIITNNTGITGSGDPKSHIMFVTTNTSTSDTVPALSVANNAAGAVFYAPSGVMRLENNGGAMALAAYRLFIDQLAVVTYVESDLTDADFSNSPPGTWRLAPGTWREYKP